MSLNILLIFARSDPKRGTRLKHFMVPPHCLQLIASLTSNLNHNVKIHDEYHKPVRLDLNVDIVGISVWTASSVRSYEIADAYRKRKIPVVLGGLHVSICPDEALEHADSIVIGEAESVWHQVLSDAENNTLKKVYTGKTLSLAETPKPEWECFNQKDYVLLQSVSTTRGCVRDCDFCCESCKPKPNFRTRPLELVLQEIDSRPSDILAFIDNDIMANRKFAKNLLEKLIPRKIKWFGMTSIDTANDELLLDLMAASGCRTLFIGFESIDAESLIEVNKKCNNVDTYLRNIQRIHDRGIMINGSFVFGFDHDKPDVFDRTVKFGIDACLETATFTILTPYPGTTLYHRLKSENRIIDNNWSHYDTTHVVYEPKNMSKEELETGYYNAYKMFYKWDSIFRRCRINEAGFFKRVVLNIAYKKIDPFYKLLAHPIRAGFLRIIMNWYAKPYITQRG